MCWDGSLTLHTSNVSLLNHKVIDKLKLSAQHQIQLK
jgi:hypothetical protein